MWTRTAPRAAPYELSSALRAAAGSALPVDAVIASWTPSGSALPSGPGRAEPSAAVPLGPARPGTAGAWLADDPVASGSLPPLGCRSTRRPNMSAMVGRGPLGITSAGAASAFRRTGELVAGSISVSVRLCGPGPAAARTWSSRSPPRRSSTRVVSHRSSPVGSLVHGSGARSTARFCTLAQRLRKTVWRSSDRYRRSIAAATDRSCSVARHEPTHADTGQTGRRIGEAGVPSGPRYPTRARRPRRSVTSPPRSRHSHRSPPRERAAGLAAAGIPALTVKKTHGWGQPPKTWSPCM